MHNSGRDSWENSSSWYDKIVGPKGHYYHEHVVIPGTLNWLKSSSPLKLVDLACGQGVLARHLPKSASYLGIDASPSLIRAAQEANRNHNHKFLRADLTEPLALKERDFSHATIILALQNSAKPDLMLKNAFDLLKKEGKLILVLSHPCFRIPRQSSWQIDAPKKLQFRRIDRYLTPPPDPDPNAP